MLAGSPRRTGPSSAHPLGSFREIPIDTLVALAVSLLLVAINGVFVTAEFGLVAADPMRLRREAESGERSAKVAEGLVHDLSFQLSGAQLGITITSLLLGYIAEPAVGAVVESVVGGELPRGIRAAIAISIAAVVQMVLGELVPKSVAISYPERSIRVLALPMRLYGIVAGPAIGLFEGTSNRIVRALGVEPRGEIESTRSREELQFLIRSSGEVGTLDPQDVTLLERSIRFGEKVAADVLVPRVEIVAIGRDRSVAELTALAVESGYSRFPVIGEDLDDVLGVVHIKSIFGLPLDDRASTPVQTIMSEVLAVPEARDLDELFDDFRATRSYLAVVVDEHGGTAGIITLEDLLEELVGEIDDEYDDQPSTLTKIDQGGSFVLPARLHHDEVLEACGFDMPEGEYETLAGFVLDRLDHIPQPGERFEHDGWQIEVVAMERLRVATVRLRAPRERVDPEADR
jgi:CBS domain containing-hemolysin-like protein